MLVFFVLIIIATGLGVYTDWGIFQIIGVILFITVIFDMENKDKPAWKRIPWAFLALASMVSMHFYASDDIIEWIKLLASILLLLVSASSCWALIHAKPGDGSTLTVYFLMLITSVPSGLYLLFSSLGALGIITSIL